jgi:pimeloyl-ACP methyl ester carboxylesterase
MSLATSGYAPINGLTMYYETHGDPTGRPLLLLHGGILTIELSFGALLPALAAGRRVVATELQGHGRTADIDREPTVAHLADDVVGLLEHLDIERADVFGFSLGGYVALELGVRHPDRCGDLVVASAPYRSDAYYPEIMSDPSSPRLPSKRDFERMREEYRRVAPDPEHFDAFLARTSGTVAAFAGWSTEQIRTIRSRTLLICGDTDFMPVEHLAEMRGLIPDAQLAVLPGTTHMDVTRRAELTVPMIQTFLNHD